MQRVTELSMKTITLRRLSLMLAALLFMPASPHAAVFTINMEYMETTPATFDPIEFFGQTFRYRIFEESSGNAPFSLSGFQDGDSISFNHVFAGDGLRLQELGNPYFGTANEAIGTQGILLEGWENPNDNPNNDNVVMYDSTTVLTVTDYTGSINDTVFNHASSVGGMRTAPIFSGQVVADITSSEVFLKAFNITTTFTNIQLLSPFTNLDLSSEMVARGGLFVTDDTLGVPAPGALVLLGVGLLGLGMRRRTA